MKHKRRAFSSVWIILSLVWGISFLTGAQTQIFVSPDGVGTGNGLAANPIGLTQLQARLTAAGANAQVHFAEGTYEMAAAISVPAGLTTLKFERTDPNSPNPVFVVEAPNTLPQFLTVENRSPATTITMDHLTFTDFKDIGAYGLFSLGTGTQNPAVTLTLSSVIIENCDVTATGGVLLGVAPSSSGSSGINIENSTIRNCSAPTLIYMSHGAGNGSPLISQSSIYNNETTTNLLHIEGTNGSGEIVNNTFSGNTGTDNYFNMSSLAITHNTFYESGKMNLGPNAVGLAFSIRNNIIVSASGGAFTNAGLPAGATVSYNIFGSAGGQIDYCTSGIISTNNLTPIFESVFNVNLSTKSSIPGWQYHPLINMHQPPSSWNINCGVTGAGIPAIDQIGSTRSNPPALGSYDRHLELASIPAQIFINPGIMAPRDIDLATYITNLPGGAGTVTYSLIAPSSPQANLVITGSVVTITPVAPGVHYFEYIAEQENLSDPTNNYVSRGTIEVGVYSFSNLPGVVDLASSGTCWDIMGSVEFTRAYRFITSYTGTTKPANWAADTLNHSKHRMQGFSIPLVADLDGDGYPEIIGLGVPEGHTTLLTGQFNNIQIYDGRTGKLKAKILLPGVTNFTSNGYTTSGYHTTPCPMTIVDSNRDGTKELIFAFPNAGGDVTYRSKLMSFNLVPQKTGGVTTGYTMPANPSWPTASNLPVYNTGGTSGTAIQSNYTKPLPTVVDLDGDGDPEVVVYNKVYDAKTGALLSTLERLNANPTAFVGYDAGARFDDDYLNFSYVYDMDKDGIYDIVAGGKIYKMKKESNGTFSSTVITMSGVPDGRTGVADINGDGIPDVVVLVRPSTLDRVRVVVWNPNFSAGGSFAPAIMADKTFNMTGGAALTGSNSTVYIGDIDGREQPVTENGVAKTYRLPEIAFLAGRYGYTSSTNQYGLTQHPNVSNITVANGGIPTSGSSSRSGDVVGLTWDATPGLTVGNRLKLSFVLEHDDSSCNTGFTMFDFDNDGMQEICYRDENYLRIIKAGSRPYITNSMTETSNPNEILFRTPVESYTGFEYPVIADIDNDASAEMVVMGYNDSYPYNTYSFIYAVGNGNGDKFAPALNVWNQFMYDPFKIKPDLTTPVGPAPDRLSSAYKFTRHIRDANNQIVKTIQDYNPFNGTLLQATQIDASQLPLGIYEPTVFLTEAYIVQDRNNPQAPQIRTVGTNHYIEITIGNRLAAKTDISPNTPVAVYTNNTISHATRMTPVKTLADLIPAYTSGTAPSPLGSSFTISAGDSIRVFIPVADPDDVYIVRLGDASDGTAWRFGYNSAGLSYTGLEFNQGTGVAGKAFRDCYWPDQVVRAARYTTINDLYTVQEYNEVTMNILDNDILPNNASNPFLDNLMLTNDSISKDPVAGVLTFNGVQGAGGRVTYRHDGHGELRANIDSFKYKFTFWDEAQSKRVTKEATVYIYVMKSSAGGFAACYGAVTNIELQNLPTGVSFDWFPTQNSANLMQTGRTRTTGQMFADSTYWLKPVLAGITAAVPPAQLNYYKTLDFPRGELKVSLVTPTPGTTALMRWTGLVSTEWKNPDNWVAVKTNGDDTPVNFAPTECANVIIPSNVDFYPELGTDTAYCADILMKDRAMLKNPHVLKYNNASVEFKLNASASEYNRYVMWSAPLVNMYSGDYHYRNKSNIPIISLFGGDVFMRYFQQDNPDGGSAVANHFTASFGKVDEKLVLGRAFNLMVKATSVTKDSLLRFPRTETAYNYTNENGLPATASVPRHPDSLKFITHGKNLDANGRFNLPVFGGNLNSQLVQVVNPYMAYLRIDSFLKYNTNFHNGYYIWNGELKNGFTALATLNNGNRIVVTGNPVVSDSRLIPPLQSFFIAKTSQSTPVTTVVMSPSWTTTSPALPSYKLRASTVTSGGVLNITLSKGENKAYAAMLFTPDAFNSADDPEDMPVLVYKEIPLTLYTFADDKPLVINSSRQFDMRPVQLGLRATETGEAKLVFENLETFGYDVTLIDKVNNSRTYLNVKPEYTFIITKAGEINDRFSLEMKYTGNGVTITENEAVPSALQVSGGTGYIHLQSNAGAIGNLQIYDVTGKLIYSAANLNESQFRLPVNGKQVYLVKAAVGSEQIAEKVFVK